MMYSFRINDWLLKWQQIRHSLVLPKWGLLMFALNVVFLILCNSQPDLTALSGFYKELTLRMTIAKPHHSLDLLLLYGLPIVLNRYEPIVFLPNPILNLIRIGR